MPKGLRQVALSISLLSPIVRWPDALFATKMASLIFLPERRFFAFTSFQSLSWPSLSFGSSSLISRRRQSFALSRARFRPPGNIHNRSRLRLTRRTRPRFEATSFDDLAMRPLLEISNPQRLNGLGGVPQGRLSLAADRMRERSSATSRHPAAVGHRQHQFSNPRAPLSQ